MSPLGVLLSGFVCDISDLVITILYYHIIVLTKKQYFLLKITRK